jgi:hypothetical protein
MCASQAKPPTPAATCARFTIARGPRGGDTWEVLRHYIFALALDRGAWRITRMRLDTFPR